MYRTLACILLLVASTETKSQDPGAMPDLTGRWTGTWTSTTSGHNGPLNANVSLNADGSYQARFTGRFLKVVPFRYNMKLNVVSQDAGTTTLSGSKRLLGFGTFNYTAVSDGQTFNASYTSRRDNGEFNLRR